MSRRPSMSEPFVPEDFEVPPGLDGPGFRLEALGPVHNERDHEAWMSSIAHIRSTPGWEGSRWPVPMTLEENLRDLEAHARDYANRAGFTYSILDREEVVGCLYIYPDKTGEADAAVRSWVRRVAPSSMSRCGAQSAGGSRTVGRLPSLPMPIAPSRHRTSRDGVERPVAGGPGPGPRPPP